MRGDDIAFHLLAELDAVHPRCHDVADDQVRHLFGHNFATFHAVFGGSNIVVVAQHVAKVVPHVRIVLDDHQVVTFPRGRNFVFFHRRVVENNLRFVVGMLYLDRLVLR